MKQQPVPFTKRLALALLGVAGLVLSASAQAPLDIRVALVIGNSAYANANPLANPANDAKAMGDTLRGLGFTVIELRDGQKAQMAEAIARVGAALKGKQGVGMLYYAGHGLQLDWRNYMVPVDANLTKASEVPAQTIDVNSVIDTFKAAGNRMNIVVLDACRDNPFAGTASGKGLAQVDAPPGTILAYATAPGNVADDGDDKSGNGLYTQFLLQELKKPTAKIEDVFKRVRFQVRQKSQGRQIPWESTSLEDDFFFDRTVKVARKPSREQEDALYQLEKAAWERIQQSMNASDWYAFLQLFPNGKFSEQALFKLNERDKPVVVATPTRQEASSQTIGAGSGGERLRAGDRFEFALLDPYSKVFTARFGLQIERIEGDRIVPSQPDSGYLADPMGSLVRDASFSYDPPLLLFPAEFAIGKTWQGRTERIGLIGQLAGVKSTITYTSRITGRETIQTPAGSFDTFVIESNGITANKFGNASFRFTVWAAPHIGVPIRWRRVTTSSGFGPQGELNELVSINAKR